MPELFGMITFSMKAFLRTIKKFRNRLKKKQKND